VAKHRPYRLKDVFWNFFGELRERRFSALGRSFYGGAFATLVYHWCTRAPTQRRGFPLSCTFGLFMGNIESRRADSRTADLSSSYECAVIGCWALHGLSNPAQIKGYVFLVMPSIAGYCVRARVKLGSSGVGTPRVTRGWFLCRPQPRLGRVWRCLTPGRDLSLLASTLLGAIEEIGSNG
jgi:hypothetical protein